MPGQLTSFALNTIRKIVVCDIDLLDWISSKSFQNLQDSLG